jgi:hypothetical protein
MHSKVSKSLIAGQFGISLLTFTATTLPRAITDGASVLGLAMIVWATATYVVHAARHSRKCRPQKSSDGAPAGAVPLGTNDEQGR